jgi:replicative DNA helicase
MLLAQRAAEEIVTILSEDDFFRPAHQIVFRALSSHSELS